jgi:hypothetical protein
MSARGEQCSRNSDCANGACGRPDADTDKVCCPSDEVKSHLLLDYCAGYAEGSACSYDVQCAGNGMVCENYRCQPDKKREGGVCSSNSDCQNLACGREGNTDVKVCCSSGQTASYLGFDWCSGYDNGLDCRHDSQCKSGLCDNNKCKPTSGQPGDTCSRDSDCGNRACGREGDTDVKVCCASGQTNSYLGFDWCSNYDDGEVCRHNSQCKSDLCDNNRCKPQKLPVNAVCEWNSDCQNAACGRIGDVDDAKFCCPTGQTASYFGFDWCSNEPVGAVCKHDAQCQTDNCLNGRCQPLKKQRGEDCSWDADCENDACGREGDVDRKVCCSSDAVGSFMGFDWCANYEVGKTCKHDVQCKTGNCLNGKCQPVKKQVGEDCSWNSDCENAACGREGDVDRLVCCSSDAVASNWGFDWCANYQAGQICKHDVQCVSGDCSKGRCA